MSANGIIPFHIFLGIVDVISSSSNTKISVLIKHDMSIPRLPFQKTKIPFYRHVYPCASAFVAEVFIRSFLIVEFNHCGVASRIHHKIYGLKGRSASFVSVYVLIDQHLVGSAKCLVLA